jgi:branched-chain amino acid aminotransferase
MPDELPRSTEVFLTGTAAEVTPVRQIGPHSYTPGRITETLVADYERLVRMTGAEVDQQMAA